MRKHGIILSGQVENRDLFLNEEAGFRQQGILYHNDSNTPYLIDGVKIPYKDHYPSYKRNSGSHRIATHLRKNGWDVEVVDFIHSWTEDELDAFMDSRVTSDTKFIGVSSIFPQAQAVDVNEILNSKIQKYRKKYPWMTFVGGAQNLSSLAAFDLDYYFTSFGEVGFLHFLEHGEVKHRTIEVNHKTYKTVECLHSYPAYPMADADIIYEERDYLNADECLTIELGRGCKFKCKFCNFPVLGVKTDHTRCEESLYQELLRNYEDWGITSYTLSDETVNETTEKMQMISRVAKRLPFQPQYQGFVRGDLLVSRKQDWDYMIDAGLFGHSYGIETLNHKAGSYVGKGLPPEKLKEGLLEVEEYFSARGPYNSIITMICGLPHETPETFIDGVKWLADNTRGSISPFLLTIFQPWYINLGAASNPSTFELTWQNENIIHEMTEDNIKDCDWLNLSNNEKIMVEKSFAMPMLVKWKHDTMNYFDASLLLAREVSDILDNRDIRPSIWRYHAWIDKPVEDMSKTTKELGGFDGSYLSKAFNLMEQYKQNKLNKQ